jgi:hypothetical protein
LSRFLSKDFLSGLLFIAFGVTAQYYGAKLALGTPIRMGPGYVPHKLACILLILGGLISLVPLFTSASRREKETLWIPIGVAVVAFFLAVFFGLGAAKGSGLQGWLFTLSNDTFYLIAVAELLGLLLLVLLIPVFGATRPDAEIDTVETPRWKPITMVTIGIFAFAFLFERAGLVPALIAIVFIASLGGEEFKLTEVIGNIVVLSILCIVVFKVGLGMNISVIRGVW